MIDQIRLTASTTAGAASDRGYGSLTGWPGPSEACSCGEPMHGRRMQTGKRGIPIQLIDKLRGEEIL